MLLNLTIFNNIVAIKDHFVFPVSRYSPDMTSMVNPVPFCLFNQPTQEVDVSNTFEIQG